VAANSPRHGALLCPPADFGPFGGDLLVGNFSYVAGQINAYDPNNGTFIETLDSNSAWQGLLALTFGNGVNGGDPDILYFTTGLAGGSPPMGEVNGLFAALSVVPEPSGSASLATALALFGARRARSRLQA
jgi:hypothetical protein